MKKNEQERKNISNIRKSCVAVLRKSKHNHSWKENKQNKYFYQCNGVQVSLLAKELPLHSSNSKEILNIMNMERTAFYPFHNIASANCTERKRGF